MLSSFSKMDEPIDPGFPVALRSSRPSRLGRITASLWVIVPI
jgi:hypothetical protein